MGSDHPLMSLVESCLSAPGQRPSAKKILQKVSEVQEQQCRSKMDKLSLLIQANTCDRDKMEQTIAKLKSKQQNMEDQLSIEMTESTNRIEELLNDTEELKSIIELLKKDRKIQEELVKKKEEDIGALKEKMEAEMDAIKKQAERETKLYKEEKDREMTLKEVELKNFKEILQEKEQKLDEIIHRNARRQSRYRRDYIKVSVHSLLISRYSY